MNKFVYLNVNKYFLSLAKVKITFQALFVRKLKHRIISWNFLISNLLHMYSFREKINILTSCTFLLKKFPASTEVVV
jgi:hypothetical protein